MRLLSRLGLRARLIIALVGVAVLAVDLATLYSNVGLNSRITAAAQARLQTSAGHFSDVTETLYAGGGGWSKETLATLGHLAAIDGLRLTLYGPDGAQLLAPAPGPPVEPGASASSPVRVNGRKVGSFVIARANGRLLTPEETLLEHELDRLHIIAGATSGAVALVVAVFLAFSLARPLRRVRVAADRVAAGELEARVEPGGYDEARAVGQAINRLAETLQREEELRKENLADLTHELRTPVMGVLGRIEAQQDGVMSDERANLEAVHEETLRLVRLLDDLAALSEAERPGLLLRKSRVDLARVAQAQISALRSQFGGKGIQLTVDLRGVWVEGDPDRLQQVAANLLGNALRYTEVGEVRVRTGPVGHDAVLEVADTGVGIGAEDLPKIFTRFWRGEKSRSRSTGGAGIGLAVVDQLVRAHGGRVEVESAPGAGSTFRVVLPRTR